MVSHNVGMHQARGENKEKQEHTPSAMSIYTINIQTLPTVSDSERFHKHVEASSKIEGWPSVFHAQRHVTHCGGKNTWK